jgi:2-polyprenyl-6-hydroxyphenyl methylase/3-demethylubiquinone-9 3-methyltransferase
LSVFSRLPLKERLFVRGRFATAPLLEVAARAEGRDLLDVGCGHGLLVALLAVGFPDRRVVGIDPDERKIEWARASVGQEPNVELLPSKIEDLATERPGAFDTVFVVDVLYLLAAKAWPPFLRSARTLLRPGGRLVIKEAEDDASWRVKKALLQERLMVTVLRRTHSSGAVGFAPRSVLAAALRDAGFAIVETVPFSRGYSTPHLLLVGRREENA